MSVSDQKSPNENTPNKNDRASQGTNPAEQKNAPGQSSSQNKGQPQAQQVGTDAKKDEQSGKTANSNTKMDKGQNENDKDASTSKTGTR